MAWNAQGAQHCRNNSKRPEIRVADAQQKGRRLAALFS
jgi:hypothetical protein